MRNKIVFMIIISILIIWFRPNIASAQFAGGGSQPGDVYKEFTFNNNQDNWRVTDPDADPVCDPGNCPSDYLPNPTLNLSVDDLEGAIGAEVVIDFWGGHEGTINKRFRFNGNSWITIPELDTLGPCPYPGNKYMQQVNHLIEIPLIHLKTGINTFEGTSGPNGWDWGQWGCYGIILRIYYDSNKPHATGQITSPIPSSTFSDNPTITATTSSNADRVDFLAYYEGYDTDGDGVFTDWHRSYHRESWASPITILNHVGTATSAPYGVTWDTQWVPDQVQGSIKLIARIRDNNGCWYVTYEVTSLSLQRTNFSVQLYKPTGVPQIYWVREGQVKSSIVNIPTLSNANAAVMHVTTWNGNDGSDDFYSKVNNWTAPKYGASHFYSYDKITVPVSTLQTGNNTISFSSSTTHHGIEIMWPGPAIVVRYDLSAGAAPIITSQPSDQTVVVGQTVTFSVQALGAAPLSYQWRKNGENVSGATGPSYTAPAVDLSDDGSVFTCVVSNAQGSVISDNALLHVVDSSTIMSENFETYAADEDPLDWLDTAANNSMLEDDSLFKVFDLSGNKVFGTASTLTNIHSHYVGAGSDTWPSYEYTGRMRMTSASSGIGVTFFSQYPQADAYYRLRRYDDNSFHISPHGTTMTGGTTDTGLVPLPNVWYRFRIQVVDMGTRTEIKARVWQDGTAEPSVWQADAYDDSATRLTFGTTGVWSFTSGSKFWDDLAVDLWSSPAQQYDLTASVVGGNGTVSPTSGTYDGGTVVTLTGSPDAGYRVLAWTGTDDDTLTANTNTVTMDGNRSVTVEFEPIPATQYTLTMAVTGNGSTTPSVGDHEYAEDELVTISAVADSGWQFDNWTGEVADPYSATTTVSMDSNKTVTAAFTPDSDIVSDDFNACTLEPMWTLIDPIGDATVSMQGAGTGDAQLLFSVPAGVSHDAWNLNTAPLLLQPANNADFTVQVKFDTAVEQRYQAQGMIIRENSDNWVRFDFHSDGENMRIFGAVTVNGSSSPMLNESITPGSPTYLRVERSGDDWTPSYSYDGGNWTVAGSFTHAMTVTEMGPFVGNFDDHDNAPAHTAVIDYFLNLANPIVPEDGGPVPESEQELAVTVTGAGTVTADPDQATYGCGDVVQLTAEPNQGWVFSGWSGDLSGSSNPATITMDFRLLQLRSPSSPYFSTI